MPVISVVSGTYNRLALLQSMIDSVRADLQGRVDYEIVLVDGGSTDGTLEWARAQADVRLIEQGALVGAIRAFNAGALAARGRYVVLANDDVVFWPRSLLRAMRFLDDTPACGAVAFADDRPEVYKLMMDATHGVQQIRAADGGARVYAQVGMVRKWLGDCLGWWGHNDPIMRHGHTYGGDAYLSARLWEFGYSVEPVRGVAVDDLIHSDSLRERNSTIELSAPSAYFQRYAQGFATPDAPLVPPRDEAGLRVLYLPIYEPGWDIQKAGKRGLREALRKIGSVVEVDYMGLLADEVGAHVVEWMRAWRPHLVLMQIHDADRLTPAVIAAMRAASPDSLLVSWCGDVWEPCYLSDAMRPVLAQMDLVTGINEPALWTLEQAGLTTLYWQIGWEPVDETALPFVKAHDVVFLASAYSDARKALGGVLRALPRNVGLYGSGWPDADGACLYDFPTGRALYKSAVLAISDNQYPDAIGFVSNRLFEAIAAGGALVLQQRVDMLEELTGLQAGVHYVEWRTPDELPGLIEHWLSPKRDRLRTRIVRAAREAAEREHSFSARVRVLLDRIEDM